MWTTTKIRRFGLQCNEGIKLQPYASSAKGKFKLQNFTKSDPISVSSLASRISSGEKQDIDSRYLRRIVASGVNDEDMETLSGLVSSGLLPDDFIQQMANPIQADWDWDCPSLNEVLSAATLSAAGVLTSVINMRLYNIDLSSVPRDNLASLSSIVSRTVEINNVTGDISVILSNIKCRMLWFYNQHLSREATESLVSAMSDNVKKVSLGVFGDDVHLDIGGVHLDIGALTAYTGQGRCGMVMCRGDTARRYRSQVVTWAHNIGWEMESAGDGYNVIVRK